MTLFQRMLGRSDIYFGGSVYMRRWKLISTPWFGVRLHNILRSDLDRELHDHPFTFCSIILRGGYFEHTVDGRKTWYAPGSVIVRSGEALHRLELPAPAWTLVFRGSMRREWGYLTAAGWQPWSGFIGSRYGVSKRDHPFASAGSV